MQQEMPITSEMPVTSEMSPVTAAGIAAAFEKMRGVLEDPQNREKEWPDIKRKVSGVVQGVDRLVKRSRLSPQPTQSAQTSPSSRASPQPLRSTSSSSQPSPQPSRLSQTSSPSRSASRRSSQEPRRQQMRTSQLLLLSDNPDTSVPFHGLLEQMKQYITDEKRRLGFIHLATSNPGFDHSTANDHIPVGPELIGWGHSLSPTPHNAALFVLDMLGDDDGAMHCTLPSMNVAPFPTQDVQSCISLLTQTMEKLRDQKTDYFWYEGDDRDVRKQIGITTEPLNSDCRIEEAGDLIPGFHFPVLCLSPSISAFHVHDKIYEAGEVPRVPVTGTCVCEFNWLYEILRLTYKRTNAYVNFYHRLRAVVRTSFGDTTYGYDEFLERAKDDCLDARCLDALHILQQGIHNITQQDIRSELEEYFANKQATKIIQSEAGKSLGLHMDYMRMSPRNSPFATEKGHPGLSSRHVKRGDIIALIHGAQVPFILRRHINGKYTIVSEAYVDGIMDGEAAEIAVWQNLEFI